MSKIAAFIVRHFPFLVPLLMWKTRILLRYIIRYRYSVVQNNLRRAFGQTRTTSELKEITEKYYHVLARYIGEVIWKSTWPKDKVITSVQVQDLDHWKAFFVQHHGIIVLVSHSGNWEYNLPILPSLLHHKVVAFYKPISSQWMDRKMYGLRSAFGMEGHPIEQTARIMAKYKNEKALYLFVADQTPLNMNGVYWNTFLDQDTPWLTGAEKLAIRYNMPVVYLEQIPAEGQSDLRYTLKFHLITTEPALMNDGAITQRYSDILEKEINNRPAYWLWSHKRWKRSHLKLSS